MENKEESMSLFEFGKMLIERGGAKDLGNNRFAGKTPDELTQDTIKENAKLRQKAISYYKSVLDNLDATNEEVKKVRRICTELKNKLKRTKMLYPDLDIRVINELDNYVELLEHIIIECSDRLNNRSERKKSAATSTPFKIVYTKLEDAVKSGDALKEIYRILINADLIDKDTHIHKDTKKGFKGYFYSNLEEFNLKGYYKRNPTPEEYLSICKNTFKLEVSNGTAMNKKTRTHKLLKIPHFNPKP